MPSALDYDRLVAACGVPHEKMFTEHGHDGRLRAARPDARRQVEVPDPGRSDDFWCQMAGVVESREDLGGPVVGVGVGEQDQVDEPRVVACGEHVAVGSELVVGRDPG